MDPLVVLAVLSGLVFAWSNGMHDTANAVATSLTTGALSPRIALGMSALLNVVGAMLAVGIAEMVGGHLVSLPVRDAGPGMVLTAFGTAIAWNLLTWWFGLPTSSSHAVIAGLAGAGIAAGAGVDWVAMLFLVVLPMVISPILAFTLTWLVMVALLRFFRDAAHDPALRGFRMGQSVTAAMLSVGHGLQDGQKTMGVMMVAVVGSGAGTMAHVPFWVRLSVALALGLGTWTAGWRIIRTLARRVVRLTPVRGCAAEGVASVLLYAAAGMLGVPVSTTMTVTAAIMGAGSTGGLRSIRWATVRWVALAWLLTPFVCFAASGIVYSSVASVL